MVNVSCVIAAVVLVLFFFRWVTNLVCSHHREVAIKALTGVWVDYDHTPYNIGDEKYETMEDGLLVKYDEKNSTQSIHQLTPEVAADWFDAIKDGNVDWL